MTWQQWASENWFTALQSLAIVSGLLFNCVTLRRDQRTRSVENLFRLTANHREVWSQLFVRPALRRVFSEDVDLARETVTADETLFVRFLVLHLNSAHQAI